MTVEVESPEVTLKRQRLLQLLNKRDATKDANGLLFYRPHKKQSWFHACESTFRYWRTGNRFGKSDMGAAEDCAFARGRREWLEDPYLATVGIPQRETKGVIICQTWDKAREIFTNEGTGNAQGKLMKFLPKKAIHSVVKEAGNIKVIRVHNVFGGISQIFLMTVASFSIDPKKAESSQWDWIHVDEPCPQEMWTGVSRGLADTNGRAWFTCTPISEPWIDQWFLTAKQLKKPLPTDEIVFNGSKAVCGGTSYDNPFVSREGLNSYFGDMAEKDRKARMEGIPLAFSSRVYSVADHMFYTEAPPGWNAPDDPSDDCTIYVALDTHPVTEQAVLFAAVDKKGYIYLYDYIFEHLTYQDLAKKVLEKIAGRSVFSIVCEPAAFIEHQSYKTSLATDLQECGLYVDKASKDLRRGLIVTKAAFTNNSIFVNEHLSRLIFELNAYTHSQKSADKVIDKNDHLMECLYRIVIQEPMWLNPKDYTGNTSGREPLF